MKLRNCFLTAVFFSVGIAFAIAEETVDEDTFRETTYTFDNSSTAERFNAYNLSFSKSARNKAADSTRLESNGVDETGSGGNAYAIGYKNDDANLISEGNSDTTAPDKNNSPNVYDLSISFYDSIPEEIGITARADVENPLVFTDIIAEAPNNIQLPPQETFALLFFDKNVFTSAHNWGQILSESYYYNVVEEDNAFVLFGSMITIPFACLSVTLALGYLLIIYTSGGHKTNI